ncbi:lycopene epsilon cyclase, chloroplastic-like isoform X3 [Rhododendron vialii]|uniref:lycopene epsilon cyclase, chloroplastic-like isoform X3 n=1 Tax=Rhododendron vialii TaxID=182163 RepID=UPI00265DFAE9|nr:lycopene epsilon cyclase, chloroplastic-like isoform X3 [Rhododendron vialii]XP_058212695.1 lycopene epsilon cyclase, chloroplastic-like isoform X3 [Rhododendron vialii]
MLGLHLHKKGSIFRRKCKIGRGNAMPIILLQTQIMESDVSYLSSKVERIIETRNGQRLIACFGIPYRFATVASGASSGKLLEYVVGGPRLSVQTAYGLEVEMIVLGLNEKEVLAPSFELLHSH